MGITAEMRRVREIAKNLYVGGNSDIKDIAIKTKVPFQTVYRWHKQDNWAALAKDEQLLDAQIKENVKRALVVGLQTFIADPKNTELKSVIAMLKDFNQAQEPSKELNHYIITFMDQLISYFHEKNLNELANQIQQHTHDLAEWLRVKNNG